MNPHILIIEDDETLGNILLQKLKSEGYVTTLVTDGKEGLEAIGTIKPTLVLLDILLPSMDGYEILEAKSADPHIKEIPVIIISNSGQPVELERALELGARDYFIKAQLDPEDIAAKVRTLAPLTAAASSASIEGKKILLVEDDVFLSEVLKKKLTNEKCVFFHAKTGEEALTLAERELPDVVLLDLILPALSGFDILEKIKTNPTTKAAHVIILSNLSQEEDIQRAKTLGADLFLVKAVSTPSEIFKVVCTVLATPREA